jgi:hypothetical protein
MVTQARREMTRNWLSSGHGTSAVIATVLGIATVATAVSTSGFQSFDVAVVLLALLWFLFGLISIVALIMEIAGRRGTVWRNWAVTPIIVVLAVASTATVVLAERSLVPPTATLTLDATIDGDALVAAGQTDPPDGALLTIGATTPHAADPFIDGHVAAVVAVGGGRYEAMFDTRGWPADRILPTVSLRADEEQPQSVIDRFGETGERLLGSGVYQDSDGVRVLSVSRELTLGGASPDP